MNPSNEPYRPRKDDHRVEPLLSGLGLERDALEGDALERDALEGDEEAEELLHEVDPERERPGRLLRWIRSARDVMRGSLSRPGRDR